MQRLPRAPQPDWRSSYTLLFTDYPPLLLNYKKTCPELPSLTREAAIHYCPQIALPSPKTPGRWEQSAEINFMPRAPRPNQKGWQTLGSTYCPALPLNHQADRGKVLIMPRVPQPNQKGWKTLWSRLPSTPLNHQGDRGKVSNPPSCPKSHIITREAGRHCGPVCPQLP